MPCRTRLIEAIAILLTRSDRWCAAGSERSLAHLPARQDGRDGVRPDHLSRSSAALLQRPTALLGRPRRRARPRACTRPGRETARRGVRPGGVYARAGRALLRG